MSKVHLKDPGWQACRGFGMYGEAAQYEATSLEHRLDVFQIHHIKASTLQASLE